MSLEVKGYEKMKNLVRQHISEKSYKRKHQVDFITKIIFMLSTIISASIIVLIVLFILSKGIMPFISSKYPEGNVNFFKFITGLKWLTPPNGYGVGFIIINTIYVSFLSLLLAVPISVLTALFIVKIAPKRLGVFLRTVIEMLSSVPSIVYGVFGAGVIVYITQWLASQFGIQTAGGVSTLSSVLVLTMMIIPTITVISEVSIRSVSRTIEEGSLALGATKTQTNFKVILASAKSGIFAGAILGVGRALGEATAVSMVAGNRFSGPSIGLFETTRTLTSTMLMGIKETVGLDYDIRFSVGAVLIVVIIITNVTLNFVKSRVGKVDV